MLLNTSQPLVTVYITNYNYASYLRQAIDSVIDQTFQNFELIIIDDGSTDSSWEIIEPYKLHPKVRVIFQENKGLSATNNVALRLSRGKYIMRLDADDYLDPNALLIMVNKLEESPNLGLVFPDYYYIDEKGNVTGQERRHNFEATVTLLDQPAHGACTMIRKTNLIGVGGYNDQFVCQDGYDLWLRFIERHNVANINLPLFYYRRHGNNLTEQTSLILKTRAKIKELYAKRSGKPPFDTVGIILARGRQLDSADISLEPLGDKRLIDWTIEAALNADSLKTVVVSTPDPVIQQHVSDIYGNAVIVHDRPEKLALETVRFEQILDDLLQRYPLAESHRAAMILTAETPFRESFYLDKAVNTMRIFDVDVVLGVVPEFDTIYRHNGKGLVRATDNLTTTSIRNEKDYLFRSIRGMSLVSLEHFAMTGKCLEGRIGHITMESESAMEVRTVRDLDIARFLLGYYNKQKQ